MSNSALDCCKCNGTEGNGKLVRHSPPSPFAKQVGAIAFESAKHSVWCLCFGFDGGDVMAPPPRAIVPSPTDCRRFSSHELLLTCLCPCACAPDEAAVA